MAGDNMLARVAGLREAALRVIRASVTGMTADEVAHALGLSVLATRPRISELVHPPFGAKWPPQIKKSGQRRMNTSGQSAVVWVALSEAEIETKRAQSDAAA